MANSTRPGPRGIKGFPFRRKETFNSTFSRAILAPNKGERGVTLRPYPTGPPDLSRRCSGRTGQRPAAQDWTPLKE
jgi:hypothetical protein